MGPVGGLCGPSRRSQGARSPRGGQTGLEPAAGQRSGADRPGTALEAVEPGREQVR
jgi:hypothetical protein